MKKEIIGIIICILLTSVAVAPVINALTNEINEVEEPPQPAPWPPEDKCIIFGFGLIYNSKHEFNGDEYYWSFNCKNARCCVWDSHDEWCYWHHYTNGEKLYSMGPPLLIKIITDDFLFVL